MFLYLIHLIRAVSTRQGQKGVPLSWKRLLFVALWVDALIIELKIGQHFADDISKCIFEHLDEYTYIQVAKKFAKCAH